MSAAAHRSPGRPTLDEVAARAGVGPRHRVPRRQRLAAGQPGRRATRCSRPSTSWATCPTGPPARWSPGAPTRWPSWCPSPRSGSSASRSSPASSAGSAPCCPRRRCSSGSPWRSPRPSRTALEHHLTPQHVDGVLLLSLHGDDPLPALLAQRGLPVVLGGQPARARRRRHQPQLRRRRQRGRRADRRRAPARPRAAAGSPRSPARRTWAWASTVSPATGALPRPAGRRVDRRLRRLLRGERRGGDAGAARPRTPTSTRCSPRPTRWPSARCGCSRSAAGASRRRRVVGFEDSLVARQTEPPLTRCTSRSRRWAGRWPSCWSTHFIRGDEPANHHVILGTSLAKRQSA